MFFAMNTTNVNEIEIRMAFPFERKKKKKKTLSLLNVSISAYLINACLFVIHVIGVSQYIYIQCIICVIIIKRAK